MAEVPFVKKQTDLVNYSKSNLASSVRVMPDQAVPNYKIVLPRSHVVVPEPETIPPTEDEDSDSETGSRLNVNTGQHQSRATVTQMVFREIQFALEQNWVWRLHILRVKKEMEEGKDKSKCGYQLESIPN